MINYSITARCGLVVSLILAQAAAQGAETLKDAFAGAFRVGVAVGDGTLTGDDEAARSLIAAQFNSMTPENVLKWQTVHPEPGRFDFAPGDRFVAFGEERGMFLVGHTLVWHQQTPDGVFETPSGNPVTREALLQRMEDHIKTVVGHYRGRLRAWDVVNEALEDDGAMRDTPWRKIIGDDYLEHAFRFAHEADPDAALYYNDYNLHLEAKRKGAVRLVRKLKRAGCRVDGVGMQGHWNLHTPKLREIDASIRAFAKAAGNVMITELDVNVLPWPGAEVDADVARRAIASPEFDPYTKGLPDDKQAELAERYAAFFRLLVRHQERIDRVTFWALDDGRSWHNYWPIHGRTAHSMLFDRSLAPKPAFEAVLRTAPATNE